MPDVAAPAGWYFVRVWDGEGAVNGMQRFPVVVWRTGDAPGLADVLVVKPGEPSPSGLTADDKLAAVGFCPPDREWQTFFPTETVRQSAERWLSDKYGLGAVERLAEATAASVREVEAPGQGKLPVRDASPQATQPTTSDWMKRAWGDQGPPKLPGTDK
jgi:hypothetical protein